MELDAIRQYQQPKNNQWHGKPYQGRRGYNLNCGGHQCLWNPAIMEEEKEQYKQQFLC